MDLNSLLGTILSDDSVKGVSARTGASDAEVRSVLSSALPALLAGAQQQSAGSDTAASFAAALSQHGEENTADLSSFLGNVDLEDGAKIVAHLLGAQGAANVSAQTGISSSAASSVMSAAAPLLLSLLGQENKKKKKKKKTDSAAAAASTADASDLMSTLLSNVDLGSVVMSLLGTDTGTSSGKKKKKKTSDSGDVLGNLLGSLLK